MKKKHLGLIIRSVVGAGLIAVIFYKVDIANVWKGLRSVQARYLLAALSLFLFANLVGSSGGGSFCTPRDGGPAEKALLLLSGQLFLQHVSPDSIGGM